MARFLRPFSSPVFPEGLDPGGGFAALGGFLAAPPFGFAPHLVGDRLLPAGLALQEFLAADGKRVVGARGAEEAAGGARLISMISSATARRNARSWVATK
jgi:hypothetical protein